MIMRVPDDPPAQSIKGKQIPEGRRTEPVGESGRAGDALLTPKQPPTEAKQNADKREAPAPATPNRRKGDVRPPKEERRHHQRRQKDQPVLLDTRLLACRRRAAGQARINYTI